MNAPILRANGDARKLLKSKIILRDKKKSTLVKAPKEKLKRRKLSRSVFLLVKGTTTALTPATFDDDAKIDGIANKLRKERIVRVARVQRLERWPLKSLTRFVQVLTKDAPQAKFFRGAETDAPYRSLLEAFLAQPPAAENVARWQVAIVSIIAVTQPLAPEVACKRAAKIARGQGATFSTLSKHVREAQDALRDMEIASRPRVKLIEIWTDLPETVGKNFVVPPAWIATREGISLGTSASDILPPMLISGVLRRVNSDELLVDLYWRSGKKWSHRQVPRSAIADRRKIVELADFGLGVNSNNAGEIVQYLADFERENAAEISESRVSSQLGWQDKGESFLLGRKLLTPKRAGPSQRTSRVEFRGADDGDEQLARGFRLKGKFDRWRDAIAGVKDHSRVMFALYASLTAPLLRDLQVDSFVIDLCGETTTGKTTTLNWVASVWGPCLEGHEDRIVKAFESTPVFRERLLQVCRDVPVFIDETNLVHRPEDVTTFVYQASSGLGRGRGSPRGLREQTATRNVVFITGEQPATSYAKKGGVIPRTITLWGSPFGNRSEKVAKLIASINELLRDNYGYAGRKFIRYLLNHADERKSLRQQHRQREEELRKRAGSNQVAGRMVRSLAAVSVAGRLAHKALGFTWTFIDPVDKLFDAICREAKSDKATEALIAAVTWAFANRNRFCGPNARPSMSEKGVPFGGMAGAWRDGGGKVDPNADEDEQLRQHHYGEPQFRLIGFIPEMLKEMLERMKYDYEACVRIWLQRKWLHTEKDRRDHRMPLDGGRPYMIVVTHRGYEQACKASGT